MDTWGGDWHPDFTPQENDVVVHEHWGQCGFANTDLDLQLEKHGITHVVTVGLPANTCIESTSRYAMRLEMLFSCRRGRPGPARGPHSRNRISSPAC